MGEIMMNDIIKEAWEYANKISAKQQQNGFKLINVHIYNDENGNFIYAKVLLKNPNNRKKCIRPISLDKNGNWQMKEPDFKSVYSAGHGFKPLYRFNEINDFEKPIYLFEGEQKVDLAIKLGFSATTTGGSTSVQTYQWEPLARHKIVIWKDNDIAGDMWQKDVLFVLSKLDEVDVSIIDVQKLGLLEKGDIVDYVNNQYSFGEDDLAIIDKIKNLPILSDEQIQDLLADLAPTSLSQNAGEKIIIPYSNGFIEQYDDGIYFVRYNEKNELIEKTFIFSRLTIVARTHNTANENWGIWCRWIDRIGFEHNLTIPISLLHKDSREYRQQLASKGLIIATSSKATSCLDTYLNFYPTDKIALCVDSVGWHDNEYVLPNKTFGNEQMIIYQNTASNVTHYSQKGELADWRENISRKMEGQSRIVFAICVAFAGQLLSLVNENGGGFHFIGTSSKGKSLTVKIACSVWGNPKHYMCSWRATSNAQENLAAQHNHSFVALDEINLANPNTIGDVVYMLADGEGKDRMSKQGDNRPTLRWQLIYLSTGEEYLESIQKRANKPTKAGQEVRFVSLDAVVNDDLGIFDSTIDDFNTPAEQAEALLKACMTSYGTAGIAWLEHITLDKEAITDKCIRHMKIFLDCYPNLSSQARRVARLFSVVAAAGELATQAGITGWRDGQALHATKLCFENWLSNYGRDADHEERQILNQIRSFIQTHSESRFSNWGSNGFYQKVSLRVGFIKDDNYLFFQNSFEEACQPFTVKKAVSVLKKYGLLRTNETDRDTFKVNDKNGSKAGRYYCILSNILLLDEKNLHATSNMTNTAGMDGIMGNQLDISPSTQSQPVFEDMGYWEDTADMPPSFPPFPIPDNDIG